MFFLPYKYDAHAKGFPFLTVILTLICIFVYFSQVSNDNDFELGVYKFCESKLENEDIDILSTFADNCFDAMESIREADDPDQFIHDKVQATLVLQDEDYRVLATQIRASRLQQLYRDYERMVPRPLTPELVYEPNGENGVDRMVASSVAHGSWSHLLGNLFFFLLFSIPAELMERTAKFMALIGITMVTTSVGWAVTVPSGVDTGSLGLSGVVYAMIGAVAVLAPGLKYHTFYMFLIVIRGIVLVPAFVLAIVYIGQDILHVVSDTESQTNFMAHVMGGLTGVFFVLCLRTIWPKREWM